MFSNFLIEDIFNREHKRLLPNEKKSKDIGIMPGKAYQLKELFDLGPISENKNDKKENNENKENNDENKEENKEEIEEKSNIVLKLYIVKNKLLIFPISHSFF